MQVTHLRKSRLGSGKGYFAFPNTMKNARMVGSEYEPWA